MDVDGKTGRLLETDELRAEGLRGLRELMAKSSDGGVIYPRCDDKFLLAFLRCKKYRVEDAHDVLNNFAKFWYDPSHADMINGLCAERVRPIYDMGMMQFLPDTKDINGNIVTILRMGKMDVGNPHYTPRNMMALSVYILCQLFESEDFQLHGSCYVETLEGFSLVNSMAMSKQVGSSAEQKEMMSLATDTFPMRIRDIYVIHQPWYFSMFWTMVKPFLKPKLTKRLHLLGERVDILHEFVPKEGLPADFGGSNPAAVSSFLDDMEKREKETGMIGGFMFPLRVDDPTGEKRRTASPY